MATRDLPPGALGDTHVRTLFAVMGLDRPTVVLVARAARTCSLVALRALQDLREAGLVDWEDGRDGTLRATVGVAPVQVRGVPRAS